MKLIVLLVCAMSIASEPRKLTLSENQTWKFIYRHELITKNYLYEKVSGQGSFSGPQNRQKQVMKKIDVQAIDLLIQTVVKKPPQRENCPKGVLTILDREDKVVAHGCARPLSTRRGSMDQLASALELAAMIYRD